MAMMTSPPQARKLRRTVFIGWLLPALFVAGAIGCFAWHFSASALAQRYRAAPACPPPDTSVLPHGIALPGPPDPECVFRQQAHVDARNRVFSRSGTRYELVLTLDDGSQKTVTLAGSSRQTLWDAASPGSTVTVLLWHATVTEVDFSLSLRAATDNNPAVESGFSLLYAVSCLVMAGALLLVQLARRRRIPTAPPPVPLGEPGPGAVGAPSIFAADAPRTYLTVPSWWSALGRVVMIDALVAFAALRFDSGATVAAIVGLAATPLGGLYVWWFSGFALVVEQTGVTFRNHRRQVTSPWSNARLELRRGALTLVLDTPERVRRISLRGFMLYNRVNAGLVRDLELHIQRAPVVATHIAAHEHRPSGQEAVARGLRLLAWGIDLVPIFAVWWLFLLLAALIGLAVKHPVSSQTMDVVSFPAGYLAAFSYLLLTWRLGGTLGMRLLRLRLVDARSGERPSWGRVGRRFLVALPSIIVIVPMGVLIGAPPWHDRFAGTALVRRARPAELSAASA